MTPVELTVIIPAWRSVALLPRSLSSLERQTGKLRQVHVIVAINDVDWAARTLALDYAAAFERKGFRYTVLMTSPGRSAAFNEAEAIAAPGPRLFVDQDAILSPTALSSFDKLVSSMSAETFASFDIRFTRSDSPLVRCFLRAWQRLSYVRLSPVTAGVFGVSETGRRLWAEFPDINADDKFVRRLFSPDRRFVLRSENYEVIAPATFADLVSARERYSKMSRDLDCRFPPIHREIGRYEGATGILARPFDVLIFALIGLSVEIRRLKRSCFSA